MACGILISLIRVRTCAPCVASAQSEPLDYLGSPRYHSSGCESISSLASGGNCKVNQAGLSKGSWNDTSLQPQRAYTTHLRSHVRRARICLLRMEPMPALLGHRTGWVRQTPVPRRPKATGESGRWNRTHGLRVAMSPCGSRLSAWLQASFLIPIRCQINEKDVINETVWRRQSPHS